MCRSRVLTHCPQIALNTLLDNVATLAIERCLLSDLPDLISPNHITELSDEQLLALGSEPPQAREDRARAIAQAEALTAVIKVCKRHAGENPAGARSKASTLAPVASQSARLQTAQNDTLFAHPRQQVAQDDALPIGKKPQDVASRHRKPSATEHTSTTNKSIFSFNPFKETPNGSSMRSSPFGPSQSNTPSRPVSQQSTATFGTPVGARSPLDSSSQSTNIFGGGQDTSTKTGLHGYGAPNGGLKPSMGWFEPPSVGNSGRKSRAAS